MLRLTRPTTAGFSFIDVIVGVALMLVLFLALFGILRASLVLSVLVKAKAAATELASSQMEYLHGISYDALGTVGGIPAGAIPQNTTTAVDSITYNIRTLIIYKDDSADGLGAGDTNHVTTDYKLVKTEISYTVYGVPKSVALMSNFVPQGIETSTGGGAISLHVVTATGADLEDATVRIRNDATSPTVDFTTFSDNAGIVFIDGAVPSTQYQIQVSRTGYSSAQTYARTAENVDPTPGFLTTVMNQTTSATFAIDRLASLLISSFSPAQTTSFTDTFANASNLASQTDTEIANGGLIPTTDAFTGVARSLSITPSALDGWGILDATYSAPAGSSVTVRVDDAAGNPLPDTVLPGNSAGFSTFPVFLTAIATSSYPGLTLEALFTRISTSTQVSLADWSLSHTSGPLPLANVGFTLTGTKTVGADGTGASLYKTILTDTTGATGQKTESLEWDAYSLALTSEHLLESCQPSPYQLPPASATTTTLLIGTPSANTLPILVEAMSGGVVSGARVVLTKNDYAATVPTSACGIAFFNGLSEDTYSATASARGYATTTVVDILVDGHMATSTIYMP